MAMLKACLLISVAAALLNTADSYCYSTTLYARTYQLSKSILYPSTYERCTIYIKPSSFYSSGYYLMISWSSYFDVKGNMPFCTEDYVEVFLTRSYNSIGKFCSKNAGKPFTMYSRDGYAKITFRTDGYLTGTGFTFYYQLRSKSYYYINGSPWSTTCSNANSYGGSGVISSTGWPKRYQQSYSNCNYQISKSYGDQGVYLAFMDISLNDYGISKDYVQLSGWNYSYYPRLISGKLSNTSSMKTYIVYDAKMKLVLSRNLGSTYSSARGFVAGYITFTAPSTSSGSDGSGGSGGSGSESISHGSISVGAIVGGILPVTFIVFISVFCAVYAKQRQRQNRGAVVLNQTQNAAVVTSTQQTSMPQTMQAVPGNAYSKPAGAYPTATVQTGSYPTATYQYPAAASYPAQQFTTPAPPQYSSATTVQGYSNQPITAPPPYPSAGAFQPTDAASSYPPPVSSGNAAYPPPVMPPVDTVPSAPPPSYDAATRT